MDQVPIPHDCVDGFLAAYWRRPEAYLDPKVRASISGFALLDQAAVTRGSERLETDLKSGAWDERFGYLRSLDSVDAGYRLLATRRTDDLACCHQAPNERLAAVGGREIVSRRG